MSDKQGQKKKDGERKHKDNQQMRDAQHDLHGSSRGEQDHDGSGDNGSDGRNHPYADVAQNLNAVPTNNQD